MQKKIEISKIMTKTFDKIRQKQYVLYDNIYLYILNKGVKNEGINKKMVVLANNCLDSYVMYNSSCFECKAKV